MKRKLLAMLIALAMSISLLPVTALADGEDVAQVGDTTYATLADAFANADGKTVKLLTDVYLDNVIEIPEGKTITFDLNGNDITVDKDESTGRSLYAINNFGQFTLLDPVGGGSITARGIQNVGNGVMTIESGEIIACDANGGGAIWNEATLTVNGGTFKTTYVGTPNDQYGPCCLNNQGTVLITGGTFESVNRRAYAIISTGILTITPSEGKEVTVSGAHGGLAVDSGTAVVNGGSYVSTEYYGLYVSNDGKGLDPMTAAVTVNGGTFEGKSYSVWVGSDYNNPVNSSVAIYGGVFKNPLNAQSNARENAIVVYSGSFSTKPDEKYIADGYETVLRGDQWVVGTEDELTVAEVGGQKYYTLTEALNEAADGQTVKLLANSTGNTQVKIEDGRKLTLDMNGFDAGFVQKGNISIYHGGLDIIGSGKLYEEEPYYAPVMLYGSDDPQASDYTTITVGKDVILEGWSGLFINQLSSNSGGANAFGIKATVNGTLNSVKDIDGAGGHALYVNGTIKATEGNVPEIILNGATLNTELGNGMYLAGYVKTTITDSTITSVGTDSTGIEIRAGELTINGNTVISGGNGTPGAENNGNGSTSFNVALAVVQHNTKLPVEVTVNGGTFNGGAALFEKNTQNNTAEELEKVQISVKNGTFKGEVYSEDKIDFVSGGHFSESVDEKYLDNSLNAELKSASYPEAPYSYYTSMDDAIAAAKPGDVVSPVPAAGTTYTVVLDYNDGSSNSVTCVAGGNSSITLPTPIRSGYDFLGWYAGSTKVSSPYQVTGNVTLVARWSLIPSGGGSSSSGDYIVSVDSTAGGKVTVNPSRADKGDTVTITVKPNNGYELDELFVTDKNGGTVKITSKGEGKCTFTMPASKVTVEASFVKTGETDPSTLPFTDVKTGDWYYDAVAYAYDNGLMSGTSATTFSPNATTTRGMIVTILWRMEQEPSVSGQAFTDVADNMYYKDAVTWAAANGIVTGYGDGTFGPDKTITREQMAAILYRYAQYKGYDVTNMKDISGYSDADSVSSWAQEAMEWANGAGYITGVTDTTLLPQNSATRAQSATILMRFCEDTAK